NSTHLHLPLLTRHPPSSTLFPYTTLFRSILSRRAARAPSHRQVLRRDHGEGLLSDLSRRQEQRCREDQSRILRAGEEVARGCVRSEEHTSELQSLTNLVCRLLLEKKQNRSDVAERLRLAVPRHSAEQPSRLRER